MNYRGRNPNYPNYHYNPNYDMAEEFNMASPANTNRHQLLSNLPHKRSQFGQESQNLNQPKQYQGSGMP